MAKYRNFKGAFCERKNNTLLLKEILHDFLKTNHVEKKYQQASIVKNWEQIVGTPIAGHTTEIFVRVDKLYVKISSAPLKQDLLMRKEKILKIVHDFAGGQILKDIIFL